MRAVHVSEAWSVREDYDGFDAARAATEPPPSQRPGRKEVIFIGLHTLERSVSGTCPIHDMPTRHARYVGLEGGPNVTETGRLLMNDAQAAPDGLVQRSPLHGLWARLAGGLRAVRGAAHRPR